VMNLAARLQVTGSKQISYLPRAESRVRAVELRSNALSHLTERRRKTSGKQTRAQRFVAVIVLKTSFRKSYAAQHAAGLNDGP
jgi:hypothetical protein